MSKSERILWNCLRKDRIGYRFRRQFPVGPYVLDFYCAAAGLCVEVDGPLHEERKVKDLIRDQYLSDRGVETLRIPTGDFYDYDAPGVLEWAERIRLICDRRVAELRPDPD